MVRASDELGQSADERLDHLLKANEALRYEIATLKKAQEELKRSEQELADFFENASIPIHWVGSDGIIVRANRAELNALGYFRDEYVGHHITDFHADQDVIEDILVRLTRGETLRDYEARMRAKDGSIRQVLINANVRWENDKFIHMCCWTRDITERKRAERRVAAEHAVAWILAESRTLAEAAGKLLQAICERLEWEFGAFWTVDKNAQALRCIQTWHHSSSQFPKFEAACRALHFKRGVGLPGRIWKRGEPVGISDVVRETNFLRAGIAGGEDLHGAFGFPIKLGGEVLGVIEFFCREIRKPDAALPKMVEAIGSEIGQFIERLRAKAQLQEKNERLQKVVEEQGAFQEELRSQNDELLQTRMEVENERKRYHDLFEFAPDGYLVTDLKGIILEANQAAVRQLNTRLDVLMRMPLAAFVEPDQAQSLYSQLLAMRAADPPVPLEFRLRPHGLIPFDAALTTMTVRDAEGQAIGFRWLIRDVTNQKRTQEALRQSQEKLRQQAQELEQQLIASGRLVSLGEITASMAHEFNNPLGIIMGFTKDLLGETDPFSPNYRSLKIIDEETKRCEKIIRDLLQFARPRATDVCLTDVGELVRRTITLVANHLYKQKIEAVIEMDENLAEIYADPQQLEQVLVNLYLNAIDAMPEGGKLTVEAKMRPADKTPSMVVITVADTGFGIEEKDLAKIFQPFFTAKKRRGLGLGLPVCDRIIKNHGGRIEVESQPGQGTSFKVYLPLNG